MDHERAAREAFIAGECRGDAELERSVRALVDEFTDTGDWFRRVALGSGVLLEATPDPPGSAGSARSARSAGSAEGDSASGTGLDGTPRSASEPPPEFVGPYRVLEILGQGGMGVVYLAERPDRDFRMPVALKVLHPYLASPPYRNRFVAERQILAGLAHPGIARLIDGGVLEDGTPYLVMEFVEGSDLVSWADARGLDTSSRVRLFLQVCRAVGYAHRNLVVHRDLKPSNTRVTADGEVKLLDFGIARVLDAEADSEITRLHPFAGAPLTPAFASPEQRRGDAIGTPSDVYSMGRLLCRLLGATAGVESAAPTEARSHASPTSTLRAGADSPDGSPGVPDRLPADLDAILRKALREEPEDRYGSADDLGDDLVRYLEGRPVRARDGSRRYHLRKFMARNRWAVAAAGVAIVAALAGAAGLAAHTVRLGVERDRVALEAERAEAVTGFLLDLFDVAGEGTALDTIRAGTLLRLGEDRLRERLDQHPIVRLAMLDALAQANSRLGVAAVPERLWGERLDLMVALHGADHVDVARARQLFGRHLVGLRHFGRATEELEESLRIQELIAARSGQGPEERKLLASTLTILSTPLRFLDMPDSAVAVARRALAMTRAEGVGDLDLLESLHSLAFVLRGAGDLDGAEALYREVLEASVAMPPGAWTSWQLLNNFASLLRAQGKPEEAEAHFREALAVARSLSGPDALSTEGVLGNLVDLLVSLGRHAEAEALALEFEKALLETHPPDHWRAGRARARPGLVWIESDSCQRGLPFLEDAAAIYTEALGADHAWTARAQVNRAFCLVSMGETGLARPLLEASLPHLLAERDPVWHTIEMAAELLQGIHAVEGRPAEAERVRRLAVRPGAIPVAAAPPTSTVPPTP
ncbi:MAG: hypothetical protein EA350_17385 [Gemmatimonadales bacterium]|nr:MAG: hypothetical protein EA350_17385 [Gemmatimonadales bacterium]